jgi:hypothetical protein
MRKLIPVLLLLVPTGCIAPDGQAMANTVNAMAEEHNNMLDAFDAVVDRSEGSPDVKEMLQREIRNSRSKYYRLSSEVLHNLNIATQIDYDQALTVLNDVLKKDEE